VIYQPWESQSNEGSQPAFRNRDKHTETVSKIAIQASLRFPYYSDPQSGLDIPNRSIARGKGLPYTLNPMPFYPLLSMSSEPICGWLG
jgi:hypothetical protein